MKNKAFAAPSFPVIIVCINCCLFPFAFSHSSIDPVVLPRQIVWSICMLLLVGYLFRVFVKKQQWSVTTADLLLISLPLIYFISVFQSNVISEAYYTLSKVFLFFTFPILIKLLLVERKWDETLIYRAVLLVGFVSCAWALWQFYSLWSSGVHVFEENNLYGIKASYGHKNLFSSYLFLSLVFALLQLTEESNKVWRILTIVMFLIYLLMIVLIQTRAVYVALAITSLVAAVVAIWVFKKKYTKRQVWGVVLLVILTLILLVGYIYKHPNIFGQITRVESIRERLFIWRNTWMMIQQHILFGVGAGNWQIYFPKYGLIHFYDTNYLISEGITNFQRPHNDFLWVLSETGLLGGVIYGLLFIWIIYQLVHFIITSNSDDKKMKCLFLLIGIVGYIVIAMFDFPLERMEHQFLLGILIGYILYNFRDSNVIRKVDLSRWHLMILLAIYSFSLVVSLYRYDGEKHSQRLIKAHHNGQWDKMIKEGGQAKNVFYQLDPFSIPLDWYIGVAYFSKEQMQEAMLHFEQAYALHPNQLHVLNNYATCLEKAGKHDQAIRLFEKMYGISTHFAEGNINLAGAYFNHGEYDKAYHVIQQMKYDEKNPRLTQFQITILAKQMELMMTSTITTKTKMNIQQCLPYDSCIISKLVLAQKEGVEFDSIFGRE